MAGVSSTLSRVVCAVTVVFGVTGLLLASSEAAGAAGGSTSPPVGGVATTCSSTATLTVNATAPVSTTIAPTCAFAANSSVTIAYQGSTLETITAPASGLITFTVNAEDPSLSVDATAYQSAVYGTNTITASGTNTSGASNTATALVDLVAPSSSTGSGSGGLAFTGADLAALIAAALALILLGTGVVLYTRRRASHVHSS
jgi:3D (Asp-Asp-Asp) domain-containing protein